MFLTIQGSLFALLIIKQVTGLYVSDGMSILQYDTESEEVITIYKQNHSRIIGLAFDIEDRVLFWSDISDAYRGIYKLTIKPGLRDQGDPIRIIDKDVQEVNGLAVDYISKHLYWTEERSRGIYVTDYDGQNTQMFSLPTLKPRGITVHPEEGYLFWTDQSKHTIERSRLDGSDHVTLVSTDVYWPNQITVNQSTLYWVDGWQRVLMSCDFSGADVRHISPLSQLVGTNHVFGLGIEGDHAYIGAWHPGYLIQADLVGSFTVFKKQTIGLNLFSLASTDPLTQQYSIQSPCQDHPCSNLCLPKGRTGYRCSCPLYQGQTLSSDGHTCAEPSEVMLYTSAVDGYIAMQDPHQLQPLDRYVIARSTQPTAITYDPVDKLIYWSDVKEKAIRSCKLDGSDQQIFLQRNQSIGTVDGLTFDYVHRNLYFTNMGVATADGVTYGWHRIEMISADRARRRIIVTNAEKPRGLSIDYDHNELLYTDWGVDGSVWRCGLDGRNGRQILKDMQNPNRVQYYNGEVYVFDSRYKSQLPPDGLINVNRPIEDNYPKGHLYYTNSEGSKTQWRKIATGQQEQEEEFIFSVTVSTGVLYHLDWGNNMINPKDWDNDGLNQTIPVNKPMDLLIAKTRVSQAVPSNHCDDADCDDICVVTSRDVPACYCDSYNNDVNCRVSNDFIVVADLTAIVMKTFSGVDQSSFVIQDGCYNNYVSLGYNSKTNSIYYSDNARRQILSYSLDTQKERVLVESAGIVDSLFFDEGSYNLFWTDYLRSQVMMLDLNSQSSNQIIADKRAKPRGVAYDAYNRVLYWSEWGKQPGIYFKSITGQTVQKHNTDLKSVNGLALDATGRVLYAADMSTKKIYKCSLDGSGCDAIRTLVPLPPLYNLQLSNIRDVLYFSSWGDQAMTSQSTSSDDINLVRRSKRSGTVSALHIMTGTVIPVIEDLTRPGGFYLQSRVTPRCPSNHGCSDGCLPLVGDLYACLCPPTSKLGPDQNNCIPADWFVVPSDLCPEGCPLFMTCSQRHLGYDATCVCKAGYEPNNQQCISCQPGYFKGHLGDGQCLECPSRSGSSLDRTRCLCPQNQVWDWIHLICQDNRPGQCPAETFDVTDCSNATRCRSDIDCEGLDRCCDLCDERYCTAPVNINHCVYQDRVYSIGESFHKDSCTKCTCTGNEGTPQKSGYHSSLQCDTEECPLVYCQEEYQYRVPGSCCIHCLTPSQALAACHPLMIQNCPRNLLSYALPPDQSYVDIDFSLRIIDYSNLRREINVTTNPDISRVWWTSDDTVVGVDSSVEAWSVEGYVESDDCQYSVTVMDSISPTLTCPVDSYIYTNNPNKTQAIWGPAHAIDNVRVSALVRTNVTQFYDWLAVGSHPMTYEATDTAQNTATCQFNIHVISTKLSCDSLPVILNGRLSCDHETCHVICSQGYDRNPIVDVKPYYTCSNGGWVPDLPSNLDIMACVRLAPKVYRSQIVLLFDSTNHNTAERDVIVSVNDVMEQIYTSKYPSVSSTVSYSKITDSGDGKGNKIKRSIDNEPLKRRYYVQLTLTSISRDDLQSVYDWLVADINGQGLFVSGNGESLPVVSSAYNPFSTGFGCMEGQQEIDLTYRCVICPYGTYAYSKSCTPCPPHTYQDTEGQTECNPCKKTEEASIRGAFIEDMCTNHPQVHPVSHKSSSAQTLKFALIGGAVGVLLCAILLAVFIALRRRKRNQKPDTRRILPEDSNQMQFSNDIYMESVDVPSRVADTNVDEVEGAAGPDLDDGLPVSSKLKEFIEKEEKEDQPTPYSSVRVK